MEDILEDFLIIAFVCIAMLSVFFLALKKKYAEKVLKEQWHQDFYEFYRG